MSHHPNILFIMSDDHAAHAISACGSVITTTPQLDRIATEGARLDNCFCTNAICAPSRGVILTGRHSHLNGVLTLVDELDNRQDTVARQLQAAGYQTAIFGKWHLGHGPLADPRGFDEWRILPGHGVYHDPEFYFNGTLTPCSGYVTDLITDFALDWLEGVDRDRPFFAMVHHKAPHRPWQPDEAHAHLFDDVEIPYPPTFDDTYEHRAAAAANATMRIERDLTLTDMKMPVPHGLSPDEAKRWHYQRYIKDYLRCVASVDDNVGRLLDYLDDCGLTENTIVIYTSDQGFFLGDHGWYDKRFMYEESLRMPFLIRYPREIPAGSVIRQMISNLDFAPTFLDYAGVRKPELMQGESFRQIVGGQPAPPDWRDAIYYRYWMHGADHNVAAHYGIRTDRYKLIYYYGDPLDVAGAIGPKTEPEWELFDLQTDPMELVSVYDDPAYRELRDHLTEQLARLQQEAGDQPYVAG